MVILVSLLCWISVIACIDPSGSYPSLPEGPGLTVDEIFNVEQGVYLVKQAQALGWLNLVPGTSQEAYRVENHYNPDHPPLGRWWLGIHHELTRYLFPPNQPDGLITTACARTGSATAFALTVFLVGWFASLSAGRAVGAMAAISLVLMPRVFGHAHLASLESITNLACTSAVLSAGYAFRGPVSPRWQAGFFSGVILGLALITKIQAVLIPVPVICWMLWRWRFQAIGPLVAWLVTAFVVFLLTWPYLWNDSIAHILEYLGRATNRATIYVWYFGQKYPDKQVPWHYPFVIFFLTVPVVLHALGLFGLWISFAKTKTTRASQQRLPATPQPVARDHVRGNHDDSRPEYDFATDLLIFAVAVFPLFVFAVPGIAVYDCERLFLPSFPLWAIFIGRGWVYFGNGLFNCIRSQLFTRIVCAGLIAQVTIPMFSMAPCHLSYYNEVVSYALGGAEKAGLEVDYWGVGLTRKLLQEMAESIPEGSTVAITPTLHQFQADDFLRQSPILRSHHIRITEYHPEQSTPDYLIAYLRRADLRLDLQQPDPDQVIVVTRRQGNTLSYAAPVPR